MIDNQNLILSEIKNKIYTIREVQVMLDSDLAKFYGVETKALNQAVKRNIKRFPEKYCFKLNIIENENLKSQIVTSSSSYGGKRKLPLVFTEAGVAMLSAILKSNKAIEISIQIINAFILIRTLISKNGEVLVRLNILERKSSDSETKIDKIFSLLENSNLKKNQGIFFNGEIFDSHVFISDLIKSAKTDLILIDNYVDETTLLLFNKRNANVKVTIYTKITANLKLDLDKFNSQYDDINIKEFNLSHDRFLIIDKKEVYHIGASLKDIGKKWFAFSKLEIESLSIIDKLN